MAKKKKTQLKPVQRGFATTSIPKKTEVAEETNVAPQDPVKEHQLVDEENKPSSSKSNSEYPQDIVANESLQPERDHVALLDKYQDRTDKDITRFLKSIEFDRRLSQTYDKLELHPAHLDKLLNLIESTASYHSSIDAYLEDKVLPQLGLIYGVFRKLDIEEERIVHCLTTTDILDINQAFKWAWNICPHHLCLHSSEEELTSERPHGYGPFKPVLLITEQFRFHVSESITCPANPSDKGTPSASLTKGFIEKADNHLLAVDSMLSDEYDDPNLMYAQLKARIYEIENSPGNNNSTGILGRLSARLIAVQSDYCFREREGEDLFIAEKSKIDMRLLEQKLARNSSEEPAARKATKPLANSPTQTLSNSEAINDIFEDDADEEGIFGIILDGLPESEVVEGTQVQIRDMATPKHWTGRSARLLLLDVVRKLNRFALVSYRLLPTTRTSIAKRAVVSIRWNDSFVGEWCMENIGCVTVDQAEEFISTVALHGITFQQAEGFATGSTSNAGSMVQANIRFLPPVFRDLWEDLEARRKDAEIAENCRIWSLLYDIYEKKKKVPALPKSTPVTSSTSGSHKNRVAPSEMARSEKEVENLYHSRRNSAAYAFMLEQRKRLPIASYREEILATMESSRVIVISGETGCGKSTQVPSFILEESLSKGKYCKIYCTEPRRISAISLAQRVSTELGDPPGNLGTNSSLIGYSIRLESNTSRMSRLIFSTYGIVLRMLEKRHNSKDAIAPFDDVTHVIIDEVHERNLDSDFLLIVLKSLLETNKDLRIILMSATLNAKKLSEFFCDCPVITVPGRTFPVDVQFLEDAVEYTNWSIEKDSPLARRDDALQNKISIMLNEDLLLTEDLIEPDPETSLEKRYSQLTRTTVSLLDDRQIPYTLIVRMLERLCFEDATFHKYSKAILIFMPGLAEIRRLHDTLSDHALFGVEEEFQIYPLHSTMTNEQQSSVFDLLPTSMRKIVISTNIAETGVTIPDITCVIDTGKHREMRYDEKRQISRLIETFITKSNAKQRRGRAGRVQAGLCFHLFTKFRFEKYMQDDPIPEMSRLSLSSIALKIKTLDLNLGNSIEDVLSRALDPPLEANVQRAVQALIDVKALTSNQDITPMGKLLSRLPTDVHLGKVLLCAVVFKCLDPALTIVAALNSKSPFVTPFGLEQQADKAHKSFQIDNSDFLTIHNAFSAWRNACSNPSLARKFCHSNFLSFQDLQQIEDLRQQFLGYLIDSGLVKLSINESEDFARLRFSRNRTRFVRVPSDLDHNSNNTSYMNAALVFGLYPRLLSMDTAHEQLRTVSNNQVAYIHPSSVNMKKRLAEYSGNFLCYFTLMQSKRLYAWETGPVDNLALALLCGECEFKPFVGSLVIDRKVKFRLGLKTCAALEQLRQHLTSILALKIRSIPLNEPQTEWYNLALSMLSRLNPDEVNLEITVV